MSTAHAVTHLFIGGKHHTIDTFKKLTTSYKMFPYDHLAILLHASADRMDVGAYPSPWIGMREAFLLQDIRGAKGQTIMLSHLSQSSQRSAE